MVQQGSLSKGMQEWDYAEIPINVSKAIQCIVHITAREYYIQHEYKNDSLESSIFWTTTNDPICPDEI